MKDLRVVKTKDILYEALLLSLQSKPIDKITITEICSLAKINRGTFYRYFETVQQLFDEYFDIVQQKLKDAYIEPYKKTNFEVKFIDPKIVRFFNHILEHKNFYRFALLESSDIQYYKKVFQVLKEILNQTYEKSYADNEVEYDYAISYQSNAIIGLLIEWIQRNFEETPDQLNLLALKLSRTLSNKINNVYA